MKSETGRQATDDDNRIGFGAWLFEQASIERLPYVLGIVAILAICAGLFPDCMVIAVILALGGIFHVWRSIQAPSLDVPLAIGLFILFGISSGILYATAVAIFRRKQPDWPTCRTITLLASALCVVLGGLALVSGGRSATHLATSEKPLFQTGLGSRGWSINNLRQIAVASHSYHDVNRRLPTGLILDSRGNALHGWETPLLPYLEHQPLFQRMDLNVRWDDPKNREVMTRRVPEFENPWLSGLRNGEFAENHYSANIYLLGSTRRKTLKDVPDGLAATLIFAEAAGNFQPWGKPGNWRDASIGLNRSDGFGHPVGGTTVAFAFADGHVRLVDGSRISLGVLKAISTPDGGETEKLDD